MRLSGFVLALATFAFVLAACSPFGGDGVSGDPERLLVLGGGDFTEEEFRILVLASFATSFTTESLCASVLGLSPEAAADVISTTQENEGADIVQLAIPEDRIRAAAIIIEECLRLPPPADPE